MKKKNTLKSVAFMIAASKLLEADLDFLFISIIESSSNMIMVYI